MRKKKEAGLPPLSDDDAPELTAEWFEGADLMEGERVIRRGRPKLDTPKEAVKLRLDRDVVAAYRNSGPGWQTRMNDALRKAAGLKKKAG